MRSFLRWALPCFALLLLAFSPTEEKNSYKCLLQMVNYEGEKAYVIVSLMKPDGKYAKTLYIMGKDDKWYHEIDEWWSYFGRKKYNVDGITGATVGGGERNMFSISLPADKIDQGYKIRFETSVEDQNYYPADLEIPYTSDLPKDKVEGSGYIRYVRLLAQ